MTVVRFFQPIHLQEILLGSPSTLGSFESSLFPKDVCFIIYLYAYYEIHFLQYFQVNTVLLLL